METLPLQTHPGGAVARPCEWDALLGPPRVVGFVPTVRPPQPRPLPGHLARPPHGLLTSTVGACLEPRPPRSPTLTYAPPHLPTLRSLSLAHRSTKPRLTRLLREALPTHDQNKRTLNNFPRFPWPH